MALTVLTKSNLPSLVTSPIAMSSSYTLVSKILSPILVTQGSRFFSTSLRNLIRVGRTSSNLGHTHKRFYHSGLPGSKNILPRSNLGHTQMKFHPTTLQPNLGHTQMRFYRRSVTQYKTATNSVRKLLMQQGEWGYFAWKHRLYFMIFGCCAVGTLSFGNWETVPYTKRTHLVTRSDKLDHWLSNKQFMSIKTENKARILPAKNPVSERIFKISENILEALERDMELNQGSMTLSYASANDSLKKKMKLVEKPWLARRIERKKGKFHLNGMHWEVMVIDEPEVNAFCLPNGKIVVYTGLLNRVCKSDEEIATVIGHEVGHVLARHVSERLMRILWILGVSWVVSSALSLEGSGFSQLRDKAVQYLIEYPLSRRREAEADHIGLMLMASAGYDPQKAPAVYKKLSDDKSDFLSTHPTGQKRFDMLRRRETMQKAVAVYNERKFGDRFISYG